MKNAKIFSAVILLALTCCKDNSVETISTKTTIPILPLSIGNTWRVKITFPNPDTTIYDSTYVVKDTTIQNEKWFQVSTINLMQRTLDYLINRTDGLYVIPGSAPSQVFMLAKYPAKKGDEFLQGAIPMFVLSVNDTVQVPAGKIVCYHYGYGAAPLYLEELWYAPNIGLVRQNEYTIFQNARQLFGTIELVSYKIN